MLLYALQRKKYINIEELEHISDLVLKVYKEIEKCNNDTNIFYKCIKVMAEELELWNTVLECIDIEEYIYQLTNKENSTYLTKTLLLAIEHSSSLDLEYSLMDKFTDTIVISTERKDYVFKNNFVEVFSKIITRLDKKSVQDKYLDILAEVLVFCTVNIEASLKMISFIIENEIDFNESQPTIISDVYEEITDYAEEEELEKYADVLRKIEEFIEK